MTHTHCFILFVCLLGASSSTSAESFTIPAQDSTPVKGIRLRETLTLSGTIDIVPMSGMTIVLVTPSLGFIIVGKRYDLPKELGDKLATLEAGRILVEMQGTVLTFCSTAQMKKGVLGCRMFDPSRPISAVSR